MVWFYRLIMGLPPRHSSQDVQHFREAFPEYSTNRTQIHEKVRRTFPVFTYFEDVHEGWFEGMPDKPISSLRNFECEVPECQFKLEAGQVTCPQDKDLITHLIAGPLGDLKDTDSLNIYVDRILKMLNGSKISISDKFSFGLKSVVEAYYVDPYLGKSQLDNYVAREFLTKLSASIPNLTFLTTNKDINGREGSLDSNVWKWKKSCYFPFHDRFIICKIKKSFFGILIGASANSIKKRNHFIIAKLPKNDANTLYSIISECFL